MLTAVLSCFAAAAVAPWIHRHLRGAASWALALVPLALTAYFATLVPEITAGGVVHGSRPWLPGLGIALAFRLDGLSLLFALLVTGIGTLVVLYSGAYLAGHPRLGRFYLLILAFMGAMLGLVVADDLIVLYVFWELTSIASYLLIGFDHSRAAARRAALQALLVTAFGGLALLAGSILIERVVGSFQLSTVLLHGDTVQSGPLYLPILLLVLLGAFTKSAQFPFHFWLPNAMEAPAPVSAYLHSATMVKAGIYLLFRLGPVLEGTTAWTLIFVLVGGATAFWGALEALRQTDMKRLLAYTTIAALGQLVLLLGLGDPASVQAAIIFLLAHSLYKGAFFLVAGSVDHEAGTREIPALRGIGRIMPGTALAALLAGLSMAGLPPLLGFISKEAGYAAQLGLENASTLLTLLGVSINGLTVAAAAILVLRPFTGPLKPTPRKPHDPPLGMQLGPVVLALAGLVFGSMPSWLGAMLVEPATAAVLREPYPDPVELWPGNAPELVLSALTLAVGFTVYLKRTPLRRLLARGDRLARWGPAGWYDPVIDALLAIGRVQSRILERRPLGYGLLLSFAAVAVGIGGTLLARGAFPGGVAPLNVRVHEWMLTALIVAAITAAVLARSRLEALTALGVHGFAVALVFASFGAPDLAITQFLVETLTVVIAALVLVRMPRLPRKPESKPAIHLRDAIIALAAGAAVTMLLLSAIQVPLDVTVPAYYAEQSIPEGHGRNIVNVILVDFRPLDTLGEVVVIAGAAIGVFALVRLRGGVSGRGIGWPIRSLILETITRLLVLVLLLLSVFLLLRGHNEPGGGLVGGLVAALAFALVAIAYGPAPARHMLRIDARALIGAGLALALLAALVPTLYGQPILSGEWTTVTIGGRELELGTPLLFDLGVYLTVLGATVTMILTLEEE